MRPDPLGKSHPRFPKLAKSSPTLHLKTLASPAPAPCRGSSLCGEAFDLRVFVSKPLTYESSSGLRGAPGRLTRLPLRLGAPLSLPGSARVIQSLEYDSLDERHARLLIEELLPEIEKRFSIVADPAGRAI